MDGAEWVQARYECSYFQVFERLRTEVRNDVEAINKCNRANAQSGFQFGIRASSERHFVVALMSDTIQRSVAFRLADDLSSISVYGSNPSVEMLAKLTLDDDGKCRLLVKEEPLKFWQFRRQALEELFFGF